jgi:hypothetical protein
MNNLANRMVAARTERLAVRREIFKFLRGNRHLIKDRRLIRKMDYNYMGDLSDLSLITYTRKLMEAIENEN